MSWSEMKTSIALGKEPKCGGKYITCQKCGMIGGTLLHDKVSDVWHHRENDQKCLEIQKIKAAEKAAERETECQKPKVVRKTRTADKSRQKSSAGSVKQTGTKKVVRKPA